MTELAMKGCLKCSTLVCLFPSRTKHHNYCSSHTTHEEPAVPGKLPQTATTKHTQHKATVEPPSTLGTFAATKMLEVPAALNAAGGVFFAKVGALSSESSPPKRLISRTGEGAGYNRSTAKQGRDRCSMRSGSQILVHWPDLAVLFPGGQGKQNNPGVREPDMWRILVCLRSDVPDD